MRYSWNIVKGKMLSVRTHVAGSTEPRLDAFLILICRKHKNMSQGFFGTMSPWSLFRHFRPSIVEYKT